VAQKIESDKLFVKDVFQKWYRIPEYQRPFVWEADQVIELLDDVYRARQSDPDSQYFLGSMVLKKSDKQDGATKYEEYDLLDGQQRLTTLLLITAVVRDLTPKSNHARIKTCQETIYQMANPDDSIPERNRIVFDIRDEVRDFVNTYIKFDAGTNKVPELERLSQNRDANISIRNMAGAILTIRDFFKNDKSIDHFFPFLRSNVLMIYVAAEDLNDAFHLFTVMNNRGVKLRNSDILKAENLAKIVDATARSEYAKKWERIEDYFGEDFDNFLSHLRSILVKQKAGYNLLREYEDNVYAPKEFDRNTRTYTPKPPLLEKGKSTFDFIVRHYEQYRDLFDNDHYSWTKSYELHNQLALMRLGFEADYWIAPLLRYFDKFKTNDLIRFVNLLDSKISSDWIIALTPTVRIENANAIIKAIETAPNPESLFATPAFTIEAEELRRILSGAIYSRHYARYILLKIDLAYLGHTTKFSPPETISIEHILPQTPKTGSQWISDFTEKDRTQWTDRLGNLVLLSRRKNTAQGNLDYLEKKERYFKKNIELFSNSIRILNEFGTWNLDDLKKNQKETLAKLLALYGVTVTEELLNKSLEE
jgi:hypothetical protein